mgnify:CR=1 FL=1
MEVALKQRRRYPRGQMQPAGEALSRTWMSMLIRGRTLRFSKR